MFQARFTVDTVEFATEINFQNRKKLINQSKKSPFRSLELKIMIR